MHLQCHFLLRWLYTKWALMYLCVRGIDFACFCHISIGFGNLPTDCCECLLFFFWFFLFVFLFFCFSIYYLNDKWVENLILSKNKSTKIVCHWLAAGLWFSLGTLVFSINKTDHHDIPEILLKVALTTVKLILTHKN